MATRIIILEKLESSAGELRYRYALWADVPSARQAFYAKGGAVSAWSGASGTQNTAIAAGAIAEHVDTLVVPSGQTLPQVEATLVATWNAYQTAITAANPWLRYGTLWDDSTGWAAGGVS